MREDENGDINRALGVANDALTNGSPNGRKVARTVLGVIVPVLLRSPDPRIKALGLALGLAGQVVLGKKQRRIGGK